MLPYTNREWSREMSETETETEADDEGELSWVQETFADRVADEDNVTLEDVEEWYENKLEEYGDEKLARITVQSEFNSWVNAGADGEVKMITIGAQDDPFNNGEMFIGYALCIPEDSPVRLGAVMFDRNDLDPSPYMGYFYEPYTPIKGEFDIRDAQKPVGSNAYTLNAVTSTTVEEFDAEKDLDERKEMVHDFVPEAKIASIGESLSLTNDRGFAAGFGVDLRVITDAYVHEARVGDNGARLVLQDDSFVDARDLGKNVRGEDGDAGLNAFIDPELVDFDEGSILNVYGSITPNQDGKVTMSIYGVDGVYKTEREDSGGSGSAASESSASRGGSGGGGAGADEERTI